MSPQGPGFATNPAMAGNGRYRRNSMPTGAAMGPGAIAPRSMPAPNTGYAQDPTGLPQQGFGGMNTPLPTSPVGAGPAPSGPPSGAPAFTPPNAVPMQRPGVGSATGGPRISPVTPGAPTQQPQRMPAPWSPPSGGPQPPASPQSLRQQNQTNQNRQNNTF